MNGQSVQKSFLSNSRKKDKVSSSGVGDLAMAHPGDQGLAKSQDNLMVAGASWWVGTEEAFLLPP